MTSISYTCTERDKKCRLCNDKIVRGTWCIKMSGVHVSPKRVDLFFHEGCLMRGLQWAAKNRNKEAE